MGFLTMIAIVFVMVQISMAFTSIWLHRGHTHGSVKLNKTVSLIMHLWVTGLTGLDPQKWIAVHVLHHAHADTEKDPHSPRVLGFWKVLFTTIWLYHKSGTHEAIAKHARHYEQDLLDRVRYLWFFRFRGVVSLVGMVIVWGWKGAVLWVLHLFGYAFMFGLLNSVAHHFGKPRHGSKTFAANLFFLALITAGEGWHANHHNDQRSPRFGKHWWQFDLGYVLILVLKSVGLANFKESAD